MFCSEPQFVHLVQTSTNHIKILDVTENNTGPETRFCKVNFSSIVSKFLNEYKYISQISKFFSKLEADSKLGCITVCSHLVSVLDLIINGYAENSIKSKNVQVSILITTCFQVVFYKNVIKLVSSWYGSSPCNFIICRARLAEIYMKRLFLIDTFLNLSTPNVGNYVGDQVQEPAKYALNSKMEFPPKNMS